MTPHLRKKCEEMAEEFFNSITTSDGSLHPAKNYKLGFEAAHDLLMPEVEKLVELIKKIGTSGCEYELITDRRDEASFGRTRHAKDCPRCTTLENWQRFVEGDK